MRNSTPSQLCFPAVAGFTVHADFDGGAMSCDFGARLLRGMDQQTGLIERLASAIQDMRHPSYNEHSLTRFSHAAWLPGGRELLSEV